MKIILTMTALLLSVAGAKADLGNYLNVAIFGLPPRYLADVSIEHRKKLLEGLSSSPNDHRLDYSHGWIHFSSDGGDHKTPNASPTSMFWVKLLPRKNQSPLVFVHMSKPFANGAVPSNNQTFVLKKNGDGWEDVSKSVFPKDVDMTAHFRPRRQIDEIEVAAFEKIQRQDGGGTAYSFGERTIDLIWNGSQFETRKATSPKLSDD